MSEDDIMAELRAIRDLQILRLGEEAEALTDVLGAQHVSLMSELSTSEWSASSDVLGSVADEFDVTTEAVRKKKDKLLETGYIEQRGDGRGTEYRKIGLGVAAERAYHIDP